jgi:tungstate transport system substrate-binding protein
MYHLENKEQTMHRRIIRTLRKASLWLVLCATGVPAGGADTSFIRLATTTSTENSGLLNVLLPAFEKNHNYKVKVISVGTGKALRLAREGDVDVVLVHARAAEDKLVADGYGVDRRDVMYNDFVLVGPAGDPAGIRGTTDAATALSRIAATQSLFVSRGDSSGTHKKELQLWQQAGTTPGGQWYREAGQGMGKVLQIAGELEAYTLTDRGTWLAYRNKVPLVIVTEGDKRLFNPYGIIAANPAKYPDLNYEGAKALIDWIVSPAAQKMIGDFTIDQQRLFVPMHDPLESDGNP